MYVGFIGLFVCLFVSSCLVVGFKSLHLFLKSICQSLLLVFPLHLIGQTVVDSSYAFLVCTGNISGEFGQAMFRPNKPESSGVGF